MCVYVCVCGGGGIRPVSNYDHHQGAITCLPHLICRLLRTAWCEGDLV